MVYGVRRCLRIYRICRHGIGDENSGIIFDSYNTRVLCLIAVVFCGGEFSLYEFSDSWYHFIGYEFKAIVILFNEFSHFVVVADQGHNFFEGLCVNAFGEVTHHMSHLYGSISHAEVLDPGFNFGRHGFVVHYFPFVCFAICLNFASISSRLILFVNTVAVFGSKFNARLTISFLTISFLSSFFFIFLFS